MPVPAALPHLPLPAETAEALLRITADLEPAGLWWLSGYAAGRAAAGTPQPASAVAAPPGAAAAGRLTIVYGSQTGNARRAAEQLAAEAEAAGLPVRLLRADAYPLRELKQERHLQLVVSTQGDGDPPDDARDFLDFVLGSRAPRLEQLHYGVLALGDSSYPQFCAIGRRLDERLAELGATRLLPRGEADLDIDAVAAPWRVQAVAAAKAALKPVATVTPLRPGPPASTVSRDAPFAAELLAQQRIALAAGGKDVRHVELALDGAGLHYEPGDALGVWPRNAPALVDAVLEALRLDGDTAVAQAGVELPLREWLSAKRELTRLARPLVAAHAARARSADLQALLDDGPALAAWSDGRQVLDLLREAPAAWDAESLVGALRPLLPRLYSIASSRKAVGDEAHLTVAHVQWQRGGGPRHGVASHWLANAAPGARLPVYVEPNARFRLPADPSRDVVMIGPGTGVAPFRAFLQERTAVGAAGRHWLFFGNPHFRSDFLYQLEWQRALRDGTLQRIDLAFSRDGKEKVYVQHRIRERARDLVDWIEGGAHLYVCGAIAMGKDVHEALVDVLAPHAGGREAAVERLDALQREGRYARDVY
jgi:sulfite reductase (NADPH) flavoprotein alpha-component